MTVDFKGIDGGTFSRRQQAEDFQFLVVKARCSKKSKTQPAA